MPRFFQYQEVSAQARRWQSAALPHTAVTARFSQELKNHLPKTQLHKQFHFQFFPLIW